MFVLDDTEVSIPVYSPVCEFCKNRDYRGLRKCKAFDDIPLDIWEGRNKHTQPYPGDKGIRFEPIQD